MTATTPADTTTDNKKFGRSFRPVVVLKAGEVCSLKRHYRGVLREVIGYLEKLAANDHERFTFASVPNIVKHCNKYSKDRAPYKARIVEYALAYFRTHHVISKAVERVRLGVVRRGFIVTPHDSLATSGKNCCDFKGMLCVRPSGRWESSGAGGVIWWAGPSLNVPQIAERSAVDSAVQSERSAVQSAATSAERSAVDSAVQEESQCGKQCGKQCGIEMPQSVENQSTYSEGKKVSHTFSESFRAPSREAVLAVGTEGTEKNEPTNLPNPPAPETTSGAAHGRLAGWIQKNSATMGIPKGRAKESLDKLVAKHGEAITIKALNSFLNRPEGFGGLNQPWLVFAKEADIYVGQVIQEKCTKEADDLVQRRSGEQTKAEILAKLDALIPPLSEAERASVQQRVARAELLTNGLDYSISWQDLADSHTGLISDIVDKRRKLADAEVEAEEAKSWTGKIEDYL